VSLHPQQAERYTREKIVIHIDLEKATWLLDQCVKQRGEDYVYDRDGVCQYVDNASERVWVDETQRYSRKLTPEKATPSCMIGLALVKAGIPAGLFIELGINSMDAPDALDKLSEEGHLTATNLAGDLFRIAQTHQDLKHSWGFAFEKAKAGVSGDPEQA